MRINKEVLDQLQLKENNLGFIRHEDIKPLFLDSEDKEDENPPILFNISNWNSSYSIIRQLANSYEDGEIDCKCDDFKFIFNNDEGDKSFAIIYDNHIYTMTWYKNRGKIENLLYDGRVMNLEQYLYILNIIEEKGIYKFKI